MNIEKEYAVLITEAGSELSATVYFDEDERAEAFALRHVFSGQYEGRNIRYTKGKTYTIEIY